MHKRILIIATNVSSYANKNLKTGLWLGELTHFLDVVHAQNYATEIVSISGGDVPIDPESLAFFVTDKSIKMYHNDAEFMQSLKNTKSIKDCHQANYDAVYLTGGHGTMYDFVQNPTLNNLIKDFYENGEIVAAVCHGVCGLLDINLSDSTKLISDKKMTGYSWFEEALAFRKSAVPFNLEAALLKNKVQYSKAFIPLTSHVVVDNQLITGQNPFSTKAVAKAVVEQLEKR
jgi:putative intracellular protease/amidase